MGDSSRLERWLGLLASRHGSDLFLLAGEPPSMRVDGKVVPRGDGAARQPRRRGRGPADLPPHAQRAYRDQGIADASRRIAGIGRFRINLHRERGRAAATIRLLPSRVPRLGALDLAAGVELLSKIPHGLVVVGGATGSGKTTTVAALVDEINRRDARHIVTIEDPIEYEHQQMQKFIEQVEIGIDAPDFPTALRSALRQAPDVIVIGEMRDPETMRIALAAGETGHLVLTTLHTSDIAVDGLADDRLVSGRAADRRSARKSRWRSRRC